MLLYYADGMLPEWLAVEPANTERYNDIKRTISSMGLHTVCAEAHCPNITECWSSGTATFMVLGGTCTRGCRFCSVHKGAIGQDMDMLEPEKLAQVIKKWGLGYVVLTSVCRDDLQDQGAGHFASCIRAIKKLSPGTVVEVLIPDFSGDASLLKIIADAKPDVVGHNIETVERLSPVIRDRRANYRQSLRVLKSFKGIDARIYTKSAMMLGVGENEEEILQSLHDLRASRVDFVAIGQYLRPSKFQYEVKEYITPEKFDRIKRAALEMGFLYAAAGPFVRSSYRAGEYFIKRIAENR